MSFNVDVSGAPKVTPSFSDLLGEIIGLSILLYLQL